MRRYWGKFFLLLGVCAIWMIGPGGESARASSLEEIRERGVLRAGVPAFRLYPFAFTEEGALRGFDVDLVGHLAEAVGVPLELVPLYWEEVTLAWNPSYTWDRYDLVAATISVTPERSKVCDFSVPYFTTGQAVSVLPGSGILTPEQLRGKRVATSAGTTSEEVARTFFEASSIVLLGNIPECYEALLAGEVSGTVTDLATILLEPRVKSGEIAVLPKTLSREWYAVALPKGEPELRDLVGQVVEDVREVLTEKWIGGQ